MMMENIIDVELISVKKNIKVHKLLTKLNEQRFDTIIYFIIFE